MKRTRIKDISSLNLDKELTICGWIRTLRNQKMFSFAEVNDGSCLSNLQIVLEPNFLTNYNELLEKLTLGTSVSIKGLLKESPGKGQKWELKANSVTIFGTCPPDEYPLQKKQTSPEFLRTIAHLRTRTNTQGAVMRVRNSLAYATHEFFQGRGFVYVHTPIITASDCEGGGQQFCVTTLDLDHHTKLPNGHTDYSKDFFSKKSYLTVSGQLNGETFATALSDIYTFGPTFRAENSNTSRHLAEFWMIEPEIAFADLYDNIECAENYLKFVIKKTLERCPEDMEFFDKFIDKGVINRLEHVVNTPFERVTYTEAIKILEKATKKFEYQPVWGCDLQSEHERYLSEEHFKKPVVVTNYPKEIKAFYMREDEGGKTVSAMDILVPKIGEITGGSQREERYEVLEQKIKSFGLDPESYWWYLDLRRFGSVPHSGFGTGFERLVLFVTGMENIRDVIPFPRYPGHAEF